MPKSAKLGQNFLRDKNTARRIIALAEAPSGPLLEIGAGKGILSEPLLDKFPGRRVALVEIDPALVPELERRFGARAEILAGDVLEIDLAKIFPQDRVTVIGNLPYQISKPLVDWFIRHREKISAAVLMLQKDFVDKLLSGENRKKYNAQSVMFQSVFRARRCFDVPRGAFAPAPRILSTVLAVLPADAPLGAGAGEFYGFLKSCFAERRKTLWNNLAAHGAGDTLPAGFAAAGVPARMRAEQLPPDRFFALFAALKEAAANRLP